MTIGLAHKIVAHIGAAISSSATQISVNLSEYGEILNAPGDYLYLLLRGPVNRELVKVDLADSFWGHYLTVERGQGGTNAVAWPFNSLLFSTTHKDHYNAIAQAGASRIIDYNPNEILSPLYAGEKVYQSTAGCERWWKSFNAVNPYWDLITGAPCETETYEDIGWDYDLLSVGEQWDTHFDNTKWEPQFGTQGIWTPSLKWQAAFGEVEDNLYLLPIGGWEVGYRPDKVRVTNSVDHSDMTFFMLFETGNHFFLTRQPLVSGTEFDIESSWYDSYGDITAFVLKKFSAQLLFMTNLEWRVA